MLVAAKTNLRLAFPEMGNTKKLSSFAIVLVLLILANACGGGSMGGPPASGLQVSLSNASLTIFPGDAATVSNVTIMRTGSVGNVTLTVLGLPTGATLVTQDPGSGGAGSVQIGSGTAATGSYSLSVVATDGTVRGTAPLALAVGALAQVNNTSTQRFAVEMSTSFQVAEWNAGFFTRHTDALGLLGNLSSQNIRMQAVSQGVAQTTPVAWDFTVLDGFVQPILGVGDHSPEFQIAKAPAFQYDSSGNFLDTSFNTFAAFSQNLVRYYNTGGFTAPDGFHVSPSPFPITWWGIYNEPNINNNLTPALYTKMYNTVVPALQAVDPNVKFMALELADFGSEEQNYMPTFANGVTAQVDVLATHFYSSCNQKDTDHQIFATIPIFANGVQYLYSQMATHPGLVNVPVWITENNVNADYDKGGGISACNGTTFVPDQRGSSAFFAAWRPLLFSRLGKAGARALYHWSFQGDPQFGEYNDGTGQTQLSYWVDYWLERYFPSLPGTNLLPSTTTDDNEVEVLAARNDDGSAVVLVANYAVANGSDNNGAGSPRAVALDLSALGSFTNASLLMIDANTDPVNGPQPVALTPASRVQVSFGGYGVAFLRLN
jgi:Glycosyl hydrolase catalytic core